MSEPQIVMALVATATAEVVHPDGSTDEESN